MAQPGHEMVVDPADDYEMIDGKGYEDKQDVAIITPADSPSDATMDATEITAAQEEEPEEPLADEYPGMLAKYMPEIPELDVKAEGHYTWTIENWGQLGKREHSPQFEVGGIPWQVLFFPYSNNVLDQTAFYLEHGYGESENVPEGWYACAQFMIVLWNKDDPSCYVQHSATHRFNADEGDWGFSRFLEIRKLFAPGYQGHPRALIENDSVNVTAYVRIYKDPTGVLWHNFNNYDSKKETGMIGLKNQGATCYLNSLLQSLYFTNAFRKAVYQIPTEQEADRTNSAWALQRLFHQLQTSETTVGTQELTASFGWETRHIFEQQDVQELSRILMDRLEEKMKGTPAEKALANMFVGRMKTYISCINVEYESSRMEDFWDIQLNVSGNKNLHDSFRDYIQVETLEGDNKYFAEGFGLQDAKKGVIFESFPTVLHLQLKRFEYDINRDAMMKVNDRYEFPETFDAAPYLSESADKSESWTYQLHGVLVHSGDFNAGHYYAFLKPTKDGHFYRFDDEKVTRATLKESLDENFGGEYNTNATQAAMRNPYTRTISNKKSMSAYMLVYIRQTRVDEVLEPVGEEKTPEHIAQQLAQEKAEYEARRKEKEEAHLYLQAAAIWDESFRHYQGFDLAKWEPDPDAPSAPTYYRTLKTSTVGEFIQKLAEEKDLNPKHLRVWVMVNRQNKTSRPDQPLLDLDQTLDDVYRRHCPRERAIRLWVEIADTIENGSVVWPETQSAQASNYDVLVFLKYFDHESQTLTGVGHAYIKRYAKVADLLPMIGKLMNWPEKQYQNVQLFEEIKNSMIEPMKTKLTIAAAEIQDGDVICFQRPIADSEATALAQAGNYPGTREFYDYLLNRVDVWFYPRFSGSVNPEDTDAEVFSLTLNRKMNYDQFSTKVGEYLKQDPTHIRFLSMNITTNKPKSIIRKQVPSTHTGIGPGGQTLWAVLHPHTVSAYGATQREDALYYEVMEMSLQELETKKAQKILFVSDGINKEEQFELLVPKGGNVRDILATLKKKAQLDDATISNTKIYSVHQHKIQKEFALEHPISSITDFAQLVAEVIPEPELEAKAAAEVKGLKGREFSCFHFEKESSRTFGIPFTLWFVEGETLLTLKQRISARTGLKGKRLDEIKFALISRLPYSKPEYLKDDDIVFDLANTEDLLALDHLNRNKRSGAGDTLYIR